MGTVISLATRKPVAVILAYASDDKSAPPVGLKVSMSPDEWRVVINRAFYAATRAASAIDRELGRSTLYYIANGTACVWTQSRALAAKHYRLSEPPPSGGSAA